MAEKPNDAAALIYNRYVRNHNDPLRAVAASGIAATVSRGPTSSSSTTAIEPARTGYGANRIQSIISGTTTTAPRTAVRQRGGSASRAIPFVTSPTVATCRR